MASTNPAALEQLHSNLEASFASIRSLVEGWIPAYDDPNPTASAPAQERRHDPVSDKPRPSRLGLGATPTQQRELVTAAEKQLRARILGTHTRKRRGEFDYEADMALEMKRKEREAAKNKPKQPRVGSSPVDREGDEAASDANDSDDEDSRVRIATTIPSPAPTGNEGGTPAAPVAALTTTNVLNAYLNRDGKKKKKKNKKSQGGDATMAAGEAEAVHPAILAMMKQQQQAQDKVESDEQSSKAAASALSSLVGAEEGCSQAVETGNGEAAENTTVDTVGLAKRKNKKKKQKKQAQVQAQAEGATESAE
ncbi:hypothetical protein AMAG_03984 [Allomyces macrogynus ATCC 38327]|uniref:Uncharacterized protein n=1 Tax=Allomyces macrogynus (strain ATCC 38327) TaxID=578462 RepID=A0A0L0S7R4_ALLM3|nr:hypothetical protein AMAG_03984 [Allomyces macrogynus ATCC 38327]|eukprot:KNE58409.1 hypothetical protein AMAG_03984 [Allomyces macrogynus ATCC 38327]